ncbi:TIGR00730 family Rossman fold protein [Chlamydiia bacterium]|nr:TIGR00730 family Rossman fold protein [Chlamydiia bacterium]
MKRNSSMNIPSNRIMFGDDIDRTSRILDEILHGFSQMSHFKHAVSIFGASRMQPSSIYYKKATDVAHRLGNEGISIITGGGPGAMEAANKGAQLAKTQSCGLTILLPFEDGANPYVDENHCITFNYFFIRKLMFVKYSSAFIVMPGGIGTLDELFEAWTLMQTNRSKLFPIILVGREYWQGLVKWLKDYAVTQGFMSAEDMTMIHISDDIDEITGIVMNSITSHDS